MSVLESAGISRSRRTEPAPGLEASVVSIPDKRERYESLATRFAELNGGSENVTAVVIGKREQSHLTGLIRNALQNAGQLARDGVDIEARHPVWLDQRTRRMPGSYRPGMVLEDRSDSRNRQSYVIDRVHEDMYPAKTESHYCVPGRLSCVTRLDGLPHSPLAVRVFLAQLNEIL